jgi:hypothetical protein
MKPFSVVTSLFRRPEETYSLLESEFDDRWYRNQYPEAAHLKSRREVFLYYIRRGARKGHSPNRAFNERWYLNTYPDVQVAVANAEFLCGYEHYVRYGREENRATGPRGGQGDGDMHKLLDLVEAEFDAEWYLRTYPEASAHCRRTGMDAFRYYISYGVRNGHSPNSWFDEPWYVAFYADVADAIDEGFVRSGFEHFLLKGRREGRLPFYKAADYLNWKYPGITTPVGISNVDVLELKLCPPSTEFDPETARRVNFVLPTLDSELMFGGYEAALAWMWRFYQAGYEVRVLITDDAKFSENYARYQLRQRGSWSQLADAASFVNITQRYKRVPVRGGDRFIAYSAWCAHWASELAKRSDCPTIVFLIQEYEPVFHAHDSFRAVVEAAYRLPHIPLFNSRALAEYFRSHKLGAFGGRAGDGEPVWYSFEHALTAVEKPTPQALANRRGRKLIFYARPEAHAARNLFELGIVALREAVQRGIFDKQWVFSGIGALAREYTVSLGRGTQMLIAPKMAATEYGRILGDHDIGLSLMMAPHPSLVPFEMASAGLIVVTNNYDYRDKKFFASISANIISADADVESLVQALKTAVIRAMDWQGRVDGSQINWPTTWDQAVREDTFDELCKRLWGASLEMRQ